LTLCFDPQLFFDVIVSYLWEVEVPLDPKAISKLFWNLLPLVSLLALLSFFLTETYSNSFSLPFKFHSKSIFS